MLFDNNAAFVRDAAEQGISPQAIEDWHLSAIRQADFVMLHAPDGYVGLSAAMEIGFATAQDCPVFSRTAPQDIALRGLVKVVPSVYDALRAAHLRRMSQGKYVQNKNVYHVYVISVIKWYNHTHEEAYDV